MIEKPGASSPAFIGIGSNLDGPERQVERAIESLASIPGTELVARSSLYQSAPLGPIEQPEFVNAVAHLATTLSISGLFERTRDIENSQGRLRGEHWGPRVIDLDLLVYGDLAVDLDHLVVPHPGIAERNFVLLPLLEIAPELVVPGLGKVADIVVNRNEPRIFMIR